MSAGAESPLEIIEGTVQARAKDMDLDLGPAGAETLRGLVSEAVAGWTTDYQHGLRDYPLSDPDLIADRAVRNLIGYGPLQPLLDDDDVWEIMINGPTQIFAKRHTGANGYHDEVFHDDDHVERILTKILDDASAAHRKLDAADGLQDAQLDTGARLHIVHRDIGRDGHLLVNIRKFTGVAFISLDELVEHDMLSYPAASFLKAAVKARQSIVFAGPPGSGKTTMLSCCAAELDPELRVVVAEEVAGLIHHGPHQSNVRHYHCPPSHPIGLVTSTHMTTYHNRVAWRKTYRSPGEIECGRNIDAQSPLPSACRS